MKKILLLAGLLMSHQIQAGPHCQNTHLNGNYVMFQNSVSTANPHTGRCEIAIKKGLASGMCAFSISSNGSVNPGFTGPVSGTASIKPDCSAELSLDFSPAPNVTVQSDFELQFTPDKNSFIGQWGNNFGLLGTTAGTRVKKDRLD